MCFETGTTRPDAGHAHAHATTNPRHAAVLAGWVGRAKGRWPLW